MGAAVADQVVSSSSNFLVGVVVGRIGGSVELGNYSIAFFMWLVMIGLNRAALTEPLVIFTRDLATRHRLRETARSQLLFAGALTGVTAAISAALYGAGNDLWTTTLALAVALPALFAQDMWRAIGFGVHRPTTALVNDLVFIGVQILATVLVVAMGYTTAPAFIAAWGLGALAGAALGFVQFRVTPPARPGAGQLRSMWGRSRWMTGDFVTVLGIREIQFLLVSLILPRADAGGLRAAESLMGPSTVVKLTGGNVGLPIMTRRYREGGDAALTAAANRFTLWVGGAQWAYCLVMVAVGPQLLERLYGDTFEDYGWLVYPVAAHYAVSVVSFGPSIAVKVADLSHRMWMVRTVLAVLTVPPTLYIAARYGLAPTAWFAVVTGALGVLSHYVVFRPSWRRRIWPEPARDERVHDEPVHDEAAPTDTGQAQTMPEEVVARVRDRG
jgi:O-antigen/teichoic acid export membrane protein